MACWGSPSNAAPLVPTYDGIMGLQNDATDDFYLLHYSKNCLQGSLSKQCWNLVYHHP
jgi:hypothetical protein